MSSAPDLAEHGKCRLYVNGKLAGETAGGQSYVGSDNVTKDVDGGRTMDLDMPIQLCGNADNDQDHHFDGTIAYLGELSATSSLSISCPGLCSKPSDTF